MLGIDSRIARYTWSVIAVFILAVVIYRVRDIIFLFFVSLLFSYLLWPLLDLLHERLPHHSRTLALAITYIIVAGLLVFAAVEVGTRLAVELNTLIARLPSFLAELQRSNTAASHAPHGSAKAIVMYEIQKFIAEHYQQIISYLPRLAIKAVAIAKFVVFAVLVPILAFFILQDAPNIKSFILGAIPDSLHRKQMAGMGLELHALLSRYVLALFLLSSWGFVAFAAFLSLFGLPYAILLGAAEFCLELIPILGPITNMVIVIAVTVFTGSHHLVMVIIFLVVFRLVQDYVISPRVMGREMELHPLVVILAVLAGAELDGIIGAFVAVPVAAMGWIIYSHLRRRRLRVLRDVSLRPP